MYTCVACAYACTRACVKAVGGPFFREGGLQPISQILSLCVYNTLTVSTISRRLLVVHSVYRLYPGNRECAQCLQTMHSVYKPHTVSTNYAQCLQTTHSVYKLCTVSTDYTYRHIHVYAYTRVYKHIWLRGNTADARAGTFSQAPYGNILIVCTETWTTKGKRLG